MEEVEESYSDVFADEAIPLIEFNPKKNGKFTFHYLFFIINSSKIVHSSTNIMCSFWYK